MVRRSPPLAKRWVAKLWRSACGVAVSGSPNRGRSVRSRFCTTPAESRLPRTPTNNGPSGLR